MKVFFYEIGLRLDLVFGNVVVGVRFILFVKGVFFLLGNDLVGGKVVFDLVVCNRFSIIGEEENKELFFFCVVIRVMVKKFRDFDLKVSWDKLDKGNDLNIGLNEIFMFNLLKLESYIFFEN